MEHLFYKMSYMELMLKETNEQLESTYNDMIDKDIKVISNSIQDLRDRKVEGLKISNSEATIPLGNVKFSGDRVFSCDNPEFTDVAARQFFYNFDESVYTARFPKISWQIYDVDLKQFRVIEKETPVLSIRLISVKCHQSKKGLYDTFIAEYPSPN